jgi:acetyl-CoA C-acetyltransferase
MEIAARTPVLVGIGTAIQREEDPDAALEPAGLMARALEAAAADAGAPTLLAAADVIGVPRGFWDYADPGRLVADAIGATRARSVLAEIGVLQTSLFAKACSAIQRGEAEVYLVTGGEAKYRASRAQKLGREATLTEQTDVTPDEVLRPADDILHPLEMKRELVMPVRQYAVMESALRFEEKRSIADHQRHVAELWAGFNRVAGSNPEAWTPEPLGVDELIGGSEGNRMLSFPYAKLHNSQWNVDQAAGLVFCSAERAAQAGIPESRWVFPRSVTESNYMLTLVERRELHRSPGFAIAGARALRDAGLAVSDLDLLELYSCFPLAVEHQAREVGIALDRPLTVTGGMAFAGGPLNNFVIQAVARMGRLLRDGQGRNGMVNAVSGMITKQGVSLWSSAPGSEGFAAADVSRETEEATARVEVVEGASGPAKVAGYTILYGLTAPDQLIALCDLPDGRRTIAYSRDAEWMARAEREELCGQSVRLAADATMSPA